MMQAMQTGKNALFKMHLGQPDQQGEFTDAKSATNIANH
jgi:hypothetical protein